MFWSSIFKKWGNSGSNKSEDPHELTVVLHPPDWANFQMTSSKRVTGWDGALIATLAWDTPQLMRMAPRDIAFDEWIPAALENLRKRTGRPDWIAEGELLIRFGDDYTASDLLDDPFLDQARRRLQSDAIFVCCPTRNAMFAGTDMQQVAGLALFHIQSARAPDERLLGSHLFGFSDGERHFLGIAGHDEEPWDEATGSSRDADPPGSDVEGWEAPMLFETETPHGTVFLVELTALSFPETLRAIKLCFAQILRDHLSDAQFSGLIEFDIQPGPDVADGDDTALANFVLEMNQSADQADIQTLSGRPVRIGARFKRS